MGLKASVEFIGVEKDGSTWLLEANSKPTMVINYELEYDDVGPDIVLHLQSGDGRWLDIIEARPHVSAIADVIPPCFEWYIPTSIREEKGKIEVVFSVPDNPGTEYGISVKNSNWSIVLTTLVIPENRTALESYLAVLGIVVVVLLVVPAFWIWKKSA